MCRWMAWRGQPLLIEELLFKPKHGLIDQSLQPFHPGVASWPGPWRHDWSALMCGAC
jgi:hypothetical protein